ncbi:hypothetical protein D3C87_279780 [compost metagenome]
MSGKGQHNNGPRRNQKTWQDGLEEARSKLRLTADGQVGYSEDVSGGMVRTSRTSNPHRQDIDDEGEVAEPHVSHTRYRRQLKTSDEEDRERPDREVSVSSEDEVMIGSISNGEVGKMGTYAEEDSSVAEAVGTEQVVNNKRFYKEAEPELSPEELAKQLRNKELTAKFNKACTITICTMSVVAVGAIATSIVRGLWGKDNSSLMKL